MTDTFLFEQPYRGDVWRLQVANHRGKLFVSFRRWYDAAGELRPTKDGVTIPLERLPELHVALGEWLAVNPPGQLPTGQRD
jgi:hypothetical protein